jgi:transcriptional regulator with XRE-family HTH domain
MSRRNVVETIEMIYVEKTLVVNRRQKVKMIYKKIGKKIQKAREEAGLSQEETASQLGYTQAALSNYELGKRRLYLANIEQIARILNKPLSYFLEETVLESERGKGNRADEVTTEIIKLLAEMPDDEKKHLIEFLKWRKDRLK